MKKLTLFLASAIMLFTVLPDTCVKCAAVTDVSAKAAILIEAATGQVIWEKNSDEKLSMASTTKIMTTLLCLESGDLDTEFIVDSEAIKVEGSSMGLVEGDVVTKRALCYGMLLPSGNDAANAVAVKLGGSFEKFAELMNKRAAEIGMSRTCFVTPSGLEGEGHGSTAGDMALLAREAMRNPEFREICSKSSATVRFGNPPFERRLTNTNKLLTMYEGVSGIKTGFTDEAGRCLVSACEKDGIRLICVTLNAPSDWNDHISLYNHGFAAVHGETLPPPSDIYVDVVGGEADIAAVKAEGEIVIGALNTDLSKIRNEIIIQPFIYAPTKEAQTVGRVEFYYDNLYIDSLPLCVTQQIKRLEAVNKQNKQ